MGRGPAGPPLATALFPKRSSNRTHQAIKCEIKIIKNNFKNEIQNLTFDQLKKIKIYI
jgi:hypothetical protein